MRQRWLPRGVDVVVVYIREAHAHDVWPIGDAVSRTVRTPSSDKERCALAQRMCKELSMDLPLYVDPVENVFETQFAPWPLRFFVLDKQARLHYKSQPTVDLTHCPVDLETRLEAMDLS